MRRVDLFLHRYCQDPGCGNEQDTIDPKVAIALLHGLCRMHQRITLRYQQQKEAALDEQADTVGGLTATEVDEFLTLVPNQANMSNPDAVLWMNYQRLAHQLGIAVEAIRDRLADTQDDERAREAAA